MKRFLILAVMLAVFPAAFLFAEEAQAESEAAAETSVETEASGEEGSTASASEKKFIFSDVRIGAVILAESSTDDLSEFIYGDAGVGIDFEMDLPLQIPVGFSLQATGSYDPVKSKLLSTMWNMQYSVGVYYRFALGKTGVAIQPEVRYGMMIYFPVTNPEYPNELADYYIDQMVQVGVNVRYSSQDLANGHLELGAEPYFFASPETIGRNHYYGIKCSALYCF